MIRLTGGPEEAADMFIAHLKQQGVLDPSGNVVVDAAPAPDPSVRGQRSEIRHVDSGPVPVRGGQPGSAGHSERHQGQT